MKHVYKKPNIEITKRRVSSDHVRRLYEFFEKRFPKSTTKISLETKQGHTFIYDSLNDFLGGVLKLKTDSEILSEISIVEKEGDEAKEGYRLAGVYIRFGEYKGFTMYVWGGDNDESSLNKDWVEGAYAEALNLKSIFESGSKKEGDIIFDSKGKILNSTSGMSLLRKWKVVITLFFGFIGALAMWLKQ